MKSRHHPRGSRPKIWWGLLGAPGWDGRLYFQLAVNQWLWMHLSGRCSDRAEVTEDFEFVYDEPPQARSLAAALHTKNCSSP